MIEEILVLGALATGVYALLALGFTLIYGVAEVVNMAHGALFMLGAYMFFYFGPGGLHQLDPYLALIFAAISVGIVGTIFYRILIHPIEEDIIAVLIVTVGGALVFQQLVTITFGVGHVVVPTLAEGSVNILGVLVTRSKLLALAVSLSLFAAVSIFIAKTKLGKAMKAVAQDREAGMLMGVNTERLYMITMAISGALAAIAGTLITTSTSQMADPFMWLTPLAMSFAVVILGGLGSIKGTIIGALIVAYSETAVSFLFPAGVYLKTAVALAVMVAVLLLRPRGLFGKRIELEE